MFGKYFRASGIHIRAHGCIAYRETNPKVVAHAQTHRTLLREHLKGHFQQWVKENLAHVAQDHLQGFSTSG
jgi:hypothetical protein